ncbi:hypothetical protein SNEBB_003310 [Seison nebaliae]|nr:hypothetical protein SNEBB_003310 [Seison nebaliae]
MFFIINIVLLLFDYGQSNDVYPEFVSTKINHTIHAIVGEEVILPCEVKNLLPETHIIWIKKEFNSQFPNALTVGMNQFNYDWRMSVLHRINSAQNKVSNVTQQQQHHQRRRIKLTKRTSVEDIVSETWNLRISDVRLRDSGIYQCQITVNPTSKKKNIVLYVLPQKKTTNNNLTFKELLNDRYNLDRRRAVNKYLQRNRQNSKEKKILKKEEKESISRSAFRAPYFHNNSNRPLLPYLNCAWLFSLSIYVHTFF